MHDGEAALWQLPWLRLHVIARELLGVPTHSAAWPHAVRELMRCATLRRALIDAGWFN